MPDNVTDDDLETFLKHLVSHDSKMVEDDRYGGPAAGKGPARLCTADCIGSGYGLNCGIMLKRLMVLTTFFAIMTIGMSGEPNKTNSNNPSVPPQHAPGSGSTYTYDANCCTKQTAPNMDDEPFRWKAAIKKPDSWLVLLAFGTLIVVFWQTIQTKVAAKAALLNARAVINAERAWLVVKIKSDPSSSRFPKENFINVLTNVGRTPAKLKSIHIQHTVVGLADGLPVPPVYGPRWAISVPENTFVVGQDDLRIGIPLTPGEALWKHNPNRAGDTPEFFVWYGRITYEDVFRTQGATPQEIHETRWCYAWVVGEKRFVQFGPEGYNRNT